LRRVACGEPGFKGTGTFLPADKTARRQVATSNRSTAFRANFILAAEMNPQGFSAATSIMRQRFEKILEAKPATEAVNE
jgi:hypothetical protein